MKNSLLHTPVGVRDIYGKECMEKIAIENAISNVMASYGYQNIQTPTFEFFDIFNSERGSVSSKEMYKFFDRAGSTLVLRPDITPSIARCASKYFMEEDMPIRLCYKGNTFINSLEYQGKLKEFTQLGAELISDDSSQADAEMIAMLIESLIESGIKEFRVEIGDAGFFAGIIKEAEISEEDEKTLREYIEVKNYFEIEKLLNKINIKDEIKKVLLKLPELFGSVDILEQAKRITNNEAALKSIHSLEELYKLIKVYELEEHVSFDLGMLSQYKYYTGVIFKAYTYGAGDTIVTGGRYDNLIKQFGKNSPSIGFAINIDQLLIALKRQNIEITLEKSNTMVIYNSEELGNAIKFAKARRKADINIELIEKDEEKDLDDYIEYAKRNMIDKIIYMMDGNSKTFEVKI